MPYPDNPFPKDFNVKILTNSNTTNEENVNDSIQILLQNTLEWLCTSPKVSSYRVNTLKTNIENVFPQIKKRLQDINQDKFCDTECCKLLPQEVILVKNDRNKQQLEKTIKEVIVDINCGAAILRGAHIFAPGVLGMVSGVEINDYVSVYVDINKKCKRGFQKMFTDQKIFVGNGLVKMTRKDLFGDFYPSGIAVEMTKTISGCPALGDSFFPNGFVLLQNIPSIVCVHNLDPKPGESILDMCASPGNKTAHIAALMTNKGTIVALDKTPNKVKTLRNTCKTFGAKVHCFQADSTKIIAGDQTPDRKIEDGPPFLPQSFDRILLDAPCSALGQRPQFSNRSTEKVILSHIPLQRKFFEVAINLLKPEGTLTYSTCTITLAENEGIVAWALKSFDCLELVKPSLYLGGSGWPGTGLSAQDLEKIQRFGPEQEEFDSVGFFIACFRKK